MIDFLHRCGRLFASPKKAFGLVALVALVLNIAACSGGSGGGVAAVPPPPPPPTSTWQSGVFMPAATFENFCQAPRSGVDPATGQAYPDLQGTVQDENNFLRSFSDNTYLWYNEIIDRDPGLFNDPLTYFDGLRTTAITPSGADKDKFHFTVDSAEWFQLSQGGVSGGYGAELVFFRTAPPRDATIAYTEPNSPASAVNLERGAVLLEVDGVDFVNDNTQAGVDIINAGLFPETIGETHTFTVRDLGAANSRDITMTSALITSAPVQNVQVLDTPTGRVGYMLFNDHIITAEEGLVDAVNTLNAGQGIDDLVLDLRYNGGGFLFIASQMAYMIAGPGPTAGRTFELTEFNDKHPVTDPVRGTPISPTPFFNIASGFGNLPANQSLPNLGLSRVFVITGPGTCSASEAIMNGLRGVDVEVIQIGSTTCGKPYGFYEAPNCGTSYFTIQFRGINAKGFGDYTDGFSPANAGVQATTVPGCSVADDFNAMLGDPAEGRFAAALSYRDTQTCPLSTGFAQPGVSKTNASNSPADGTLLKSPWHTNRIMDTPRK